MLIPPYTCVCDPSPIMDNPISDRSSRRFPIIHPPISTSPISDNQLPLVRGCVPRLPAGLQATFTFSSNPAGSFPAFWTLLRQFESLAPVQSSKKPRVVQTAGAEEGAVDELAAIGEEADTAAARVQATGQRRAIPMSSDAGLCGRVLLLAVVVGGLLVAQPRCA